MEKYLTPTLLRSDRKTLSLSLSPKGLILRVPKRCSQAQIEHFLQKNQGWIEKNARKMAEKEKELSLIQPLTTAEVERLREVGKGVFAERVGRYAPLVGVDYRSITVKPMKTRWGSCSSKGSLNFNCLLLLAPPQVLDSVVVHELCHRKYMNHSAEFYALVEAVFPQYEDCRKWLNAYGDRLLRRLPDETERT